MHSETPPRESASRARRGVPLPALLLACLAAIPSPSAAAGPLGPEGGTLLTVAATPGPAAGAPSRLFVSHPYRDGLLLSDNPQAGWAPGPTLPFTVYQLVAAPSAPGTLYAVGFAKIGFLGGGLFRSTDGGRHWTDTHTDGIVAFAVAPSDANTAYRTATFFDGPGGPEPAVERTADGGFTWERVSGLLGGVELTAVAVDPTDPTIAYAAVQNQVYPSTDAFTQSHRAPVSVRSLRVALVSPGGPHALYAGGPGALAESLDGGVTWTVLDGFPVRPTESVDRLLADYAHPGTLYAVLNTDVPSGCPPPRSRIAKTTDGGATWTLAAPPAAEVSDLALDPAFPDRLYAASDDGFLESTDGGATFARYNHGILARQAAAVAIDPFSNLGKPTLFFADNLSGFARGLFTSTDGGATWTLSQRCLPDVVRLLPDPRTRGTLYAETVAGLYATRDGGSHWGPVSPSGGGQILDLAIDPRSSTLLYAAARFPGATADKPGYALLKSTDRGATWSSLSGAPDPQHALSAVAVDPSRSSAVFACGGGQAFRLYGSRFVAIGDLPPRTDSLYCHRLVVAPGDRDLFALTSFDALPASRLVASHDHGVHWQDAEKGLTLPAYDLASGLDPSTLYAATEGGLFVTHDSARNWSLFALPVPPFSGRAARSVFLDPRGTLAAGAGGGLYLFRVGGR